MATFHFVMLFGLSLVLISCDGKNIPLPGETELTILPGSSENFTWNYDDDPPNFAARNWFFSSSDGLHTSLLIAVINQFGINTRKDILPGMAIIQPATLSLNNVNQSYDGIYVFSLKIGSQPEVTSKVTVFIAKKPTVKLSCSSPVTLDKGNDSTCECRGVGGNPPANVTWFKNNVPFGETKKENNTLNLTDVDVTDVGTYKCVAQSYPAEAYKDEKSIQVNINSEPYDTTITVEPKTAVVGEKVMINCESEGVPGLSYRITHVDTKTVYKMKTLIIRNVQLNHTGTYECFVWNTLGNDSKSDNLTVEESRPTQPTQPTQPPKSPISPSTKPTTIEAVISSDPTAEPGSSTPIGPIVGIVIGILLLLIVGIGVYCYKKKEKDRRNRGDIDPVAGNHYELDEEPSPGDNAYDTVGPVGESGSKKKAPEKDSLPPVYAAVDKNNRQGNTLYASLDTNALKRESKKEPADRKPQTEYASIDFAKTTDVPKADLV